MNAILFSAIMGVVMMFASFLVRSSRLIRNLAILGMLFVLVMNVLEMTDIFTVSFPANDMIHADRFSLFFNTIAFTCTFLFFLLSARDMEKVGLNYAEYFSLIFFILSGIALVSSFQSLLILFLGIEIISIPLYILTGSDKKNLKSNEASLKYLLLGAFSTGLMLMGITLLYGASGTFDIYQLIKSADKPSALAMTGLMLLLFAMSFKVSAAPFHFWTPDVYDGAPTVFTSFMATVVKAAAFIGFMRLFSGAFESIHQHWRLLAAIIAALTLFIGNITAVFQQSVKRMLAYSSIAQAGFMMLAIFSLNATATEGLLLYAAAYSLATIGVFAVLVKMKDYTFEGFNGLARQHPFLAGVVTVFLLSLAGIPLTAGFLSKFYLLKATMEAGGYLWLVIFAVIMAIISVYYYFRVIQAMYFKEGEGGVLEAGSVFHWVLGILAFLVLAIGVFPNLLLYWFYF